MNTWGTFSVSCDSAIPVQLIISAHRNSSLVYSGYFLTVISASTTVCKLNTKPSCQFSVNSRPQRRFRLTSSRGLTHSKFWPDWIGQAINLFGHWFSNIASILALIVFLFLLCATCDAPGGAAATIAHTRLPSVPPSSVHARSGSAMVLLQSERSLQKPFKDDLQIGGP